MAWTTKDEINYIDLMVSRFILENRSPGPFLKNYIEQVSCWNIPGGQEHPDVDTEELKEYADKVMDLMNKIK